MITDVTGIELTPGNNGRNCPGNGQHFDGNGNLLREDKLYSTYKARPKIYIVGPAEEELPPEEELLDVEALSQDGKAIERKLEDNIGTKL